jgi:GT2 family glycosyltransferase
MIGLVLVTYAHWPEKLLASVDAAGLDVFWSIHHHGSDPAFAAQVATLAERPRTQLYMHCENRGLSRSWNEGVQEVLAAGATHAMLVNDDLHFVEGGFSTFVNFAQANIPLSVAFLQGLETGGSPYAGQVMQQGFACCSLTPAVIERVGWFDENITPAYYEDYDYYRRCVLSDVTFVTAPEVLAEHERSKTTRDNPEIQFEHEAIMTRNRDYYTQKWGVPGAETFTRPFDDPTWTNHIAWVDRADPYTLKAPAMVPETEPQRFWPALTNRLATLANRYGLRRP